MNGVRKHCSNKEVVALAKVLIRNWKQLLGEGPGPRGRVFLPAPECWLIAGTQSMAVE